MRLGCLAVFLALPLAAAVHNDTVHLDVEYQTIENFGASDCWSMQKIGAWREASKRKIADLLFSTDSGIGLSCWRFNIGAGINTKSISHPWRTAETFEIAEGRYDWSRQANEQWFLRAARDRGVAQLLAFVNSPPARMTRNGLTNATKGLGATNLKPGYEDQFARYLADILRHFRDAERIDFTYVSPVNEPQWEWDSTTQEGNRYSNQDIRNVVLALDRELRRASLKTQIAIVESGNIPDMYEADAKISAEYQTTYGNYIDTFLGDPQVSPLLANRIGFHSYGSDRLETQLLPHRRKLREKMDHYPGWKLWETEYCILEGPEGKGGSGRDLTMRTALDVARVMHFDLTVANVSAWQWWTAVSPEDYKDGLIYTDYRKPGDAETIYPAKLLWTFGNFSRFVRPGSKRIRLDGDRHDQRGLLGSAYKDDAGRRVVLVYLNLGDAAEQVAPRLVGAAGWELASLTPYITSDRAGDDLKLYPEVSPGKPVSIPPRSAVTIVARFK